MATWNLQRPVQRSRRERIEAQLRLIEADVWILTETVVDLSPGDGYQCVTSIGSDRRCRADEAWIAIWSRLPLTPLLLCGDRVRSAAALVTLPDCPPLVFCGTVLPWRGSRWGDHPSAGARAFEAALAAQQTDWGRLRKAHGELCVAGDFNQDLSGKPYYWSGRARHLLQASLEANSLRCATADPDPVRTLTNGIRASIDHICIPKRWSSSKAEAWDMGAGSNRLSDHYGAYIDVEPA